jgi:hypothetical protein
MVRLSVSSRFWTTLGMSALGLLVGLLAGLSHSPVVGGLLTLLFGFAGGAAGFLQSGRTPQQLADIGRVLFIFSALVICGILTGIYLRNADPLRVSGPPPSFVLRERLSVSELITLYKKGASSEFLRALLLANQASHGPPHKLTTSEIESLVDAQVPGTILETMILRAPETRPATETFLFERPADPQELDHRPPGQK